MRFRNQISVIIPALNEEKAIGNVLSNIPGWVDETIVVDNGSSDATAKIAKEHHAKVVVEERKGYGSACLAGIEALLDSADIVVFLDADCSQDPTEMSRIVDPILEENFDFVLGARVKDKREAGAMPGQGQFGNWLATRLIHLIWGVRYADLGPFRAIRFSSLEKLNMMDRNFGWTVEMQIRAIENKLRIGEVPVSYKKRIGTSKITGTVYGTIAAGFKILWTIAKFACFRPVTSRFDAPGRAPAVKSLENDG